MLIAGLGIWRLRFSFFHALTAARLVKKAHNSQNSRRGNDQPFSPYQWPPEYGQNNDDYSQ
jgi:hypothetical protein